MKDKHLAYMLIGGLAVLLGWQYYSEQYATRTRGGADHAARTRDSGIYGAALDNSLGQVTPQHLLWWGPSMRPPHWQPHRVRYPLAPGREIERLIYGVPGSCNDTVSKADRGWLWAPPSEVDY